jgi:hypothetical protein
VRKIRAATARTATLGPTARKPATGVGEPSRTSGIHMWKGTAPILKARPQARKTVPANAITGEYSPEAKTCRRASRPISPVAP